MAAPYMADVANLLLLLEAKEKVAARVIPQNSNDSVLLRTAAAQGAGLIGANNMVHCQTVIFPCQLLIRPTLRASTRSRS